MTNKIDNSDAKDAADIIVKWLVGRAQEGEKVGQELNDINDIKLLIKRRPAYFGFRSK